MSAFDLTELDKSIESFQETVLALKQIQEINKDLNSVAAKLHEQDTVLKTDTEKMHAAYHQVQEAMERFQAGAEDYITELKNSCSLQKTELEEVQRILIEKLENVVSDYLSRAEQLENTFSEKMKQNTKEITDCTDTILEKSTATEKAILDYTLSTQKSIDELRVLETSNARETRDKIVETDARARAEMDNRFKTVEQLTSELATMRAQQKKAQIMATVGGISAILAALSSILHFFF